MGKHRRTRIGQAVVILVVAGLLAPWAFDAVLAGTSRAEGLARARQALRPDLAERGLELGAPIFLRIFKESRELEVWLQKQSGDREWTLFRSYRICSFSGSLGPKLREGDRQSPEGLYSVGPAQLHPTSRFHLAFNLGYPNAFDRAHGRTGSYLMVHGDCVSIGCYAMTDRGIEEIYALAEAALKNGQRRFWVHAFPARLTDAWLKTKAWSQWSGFWRDLKVCYDAFEKKGILPKATVRDRRYVCT